MRAAIELFARRWWAGQLGTPGRVLSVLATPLSWAWGAGSAAGRLRAVVAGSRRVEGMAVVSVGNLAVGGTGKTPLVGWMARELMRVGVTPAVLVGSVGRDEALLHAERLPGLTVIRNRDRVAGARRAEALGATVAILDDGYQHRRLARDLDVVLLAAEDPFPAPLLPRGPYRERPRALTRADLVVVTRRCAPAARSREVAEKIRRHGTAAPVAGVELGVGPFVDLEGAAADVPARDVLAVCAIARPSAFQAAVARRVMGSTELVAFGDHHEYTPADLKRLRKRSGGRTIVVTEKDAVKMRDLPGTHEDVRVLTEQICFDWGEDELLGRLHGLAAVAGQA